MDTIFALASARGKAGVAVVRVSGPHAFDAARRLAGDVPDPRRAALRTLRDEDGAVIDEALILTFESGHSFTGEPVVEFQTHGSPAVLSLLLKQLGQIRGLRAAEAGEFTRRALENDRLDLGQVEGLSDLIEAETVAQHRQAMRSFSGRLTNTVEAWRESLVHAMSLLEATIDFADEEVPVDMSPEVLSLLSRTLASMRKELEGIPVAERLRNGFRVAIVGKPNTGKSTLMNYLAGRDVAITSSVAGTTRDVIEVQMDLDGLPLTLIDTAGIRDTSDEVEKIGVDRARNAAEISDIRLHIVESASSDLLIDQQEDDLVLVGKDDDGLQGGISGVTGAGVEALLSHIQRVLAERVDMIGSATQDRHRNAIQLAINSLEVAKEMVTGKELSPEFAAEEIRTAVSSIEMLVGRVDVEQVLDGVFSRFCIGK